MTRQHQTLSTAPLEHPAMDYRFLRREGIRHLERLAGHLWSDFNAHDPGITILEQLCYAITDLGYRIDFGMADLLADHGGEPAASLPSARAILTCEPVTNADMRKLVLDVDGVRNAWIESISQPEVVLYHHAATRQLRLEDDVYGSEPVNLRGLYRVLVAKSDAVDGPTVRRRVARRLHAHRPLGQDYEVEVLASRKIRVHARVEIGPVDSGEAVLLEIFRRLGRHLSPTVSFSTLEEMLAAGRSIDDIFDGPALVHGFLDSESLAAAVCRTSIHTSDLINEIMQVPGVRAVRTIAVSESPDGERLDWSLELPPGHVARLDLEHPDITLERENLKVVVDVERVVADYARAQDDGASHRALAAHERDLVAGVGRDRSIARYHSIQHQFPADYGIGALGLADSAPARRKAQAKQLEAYLAFFEQLLANYFAQLAHTRELFSFDSGQYRTYFAQALDDPSLRMETLRRRGSAEHRAWFDDRVESTALAGDDADSGATRLGRKNRLLNHLLARFAEDFTDYSLIVWDPSGQKTADDKIALLQRISRVSGGRSSGRNYLAGDGGRSGLEERIRLKTGLVGEAGEEFRMVEHILLRPVPEDRNQLADDGRVQVPLLSAAEYADPFSLQLSFVFPGFVDRFVAAGGGASGFRRFVEKTIRLETPAHLLPYIHWLDRDEWEAFEQGYREWQARHRAYWAEKLGL